MAETPGQGPTQEDVAKLGEALQAMGISFEGLRRRIQDEGLPEVWNITKQAWGTALNSVRRHPFQAGVGFLGTAILVGGVMADIHGAHYNKHTSVPEQPPTPPQP